MSILALGSRYATHFKPSDNEQRLNFELAEASGDFGIFALGERTFDAQESTALADPSGHIRPFHRVDLQGRKSFSSLKRVDVLRTHVSGDETFDSVMDAHNSVSAVDAITDERTNSRVHSASRCTDVHHTQRVTALKFK